MLTLFFIFYNIFEPYKQDWLNLNEGEGLYTGLLFILIDFFMWVFIMVIYSYFK